VSDLGPIYREEQRFRQRWVWLLVIGPAVLAWWSFVQQIIIGRPLGTTPSPDWVVWLILVSIGIGLPLLFLRLVLVLEVTRESVVIRFQPFARRVIRLSDIERIVVREYSAIKEYGGWGLKGWSREKVAYNVSGSRGVELFLRDGRSVMLGSQRARELAEAIEGQRGRGDPSREAGL
jgi:hypothetical protein